MEPELILGLGASFVGGSPSMATDIILGLGTYFDGGSPSKETEHGMECLLRRRHEMTRHKDSFKGLVLT